MSDPGPQIDRSPLTVGEALEQAIALHKAGRLPDAERLYRAILQAQPKHPDANHNLGVLAVGVGKPDAALPFLKAALKADPRPASYWVSYVTALIAAGALESARKAISSAERRGLPPNLFQEAKTKLRAIQPAPGQSPSTGQGPATAAQQRAPAPPTGPSRGEEEQLDTLFNQGRYVEVEKLARTLTQRFPDHGFGWSMLGAALNRCGRNQEALVPAQRGAALLPGRAEAHRNLGTILQGLGRLTEAEASLRRVLEIKPIHAEACNSLGGILLGLKRPNEAEASYRRALEIMPNFAEAHGNLGATLRELGRLEEAEACCRRAVQIKSNLPEVHNNLGNTLSDRGRLEEAETSYRRALEIRPDYAEAHNNLGTVLIRLGRLNEAEICFQRAFGIKPDYAEAHSNLGGALKDFGRLKEAEASYRRALEIKPDYVTAHSNLLLCLNYLPQVSAAVYAEHRRWDEQQTTDCVGMAPPIGNRDSHRRLRVGYVSPDFRQHPVANFFEPLLHQHDRSAVEVFCYSDVLRPDAVTSRLQGLADHWLRTTGLSDQVLAQRIADDQIDILVDLTGHTANNRLLVFAHRPAPVQVTWLGYPNTTGLRAMNYRLVDNITDPAGTADTLATEQLVRLEKGFLCYAAPPQAPQPAPPPSLTSGRITFGSFNNPAKLSPITLDAWAALLKRVPGSHLLLKGKLFNQAGGRSTFLAPLQSRGVDGGSVTLHPRTPGLENHLALYGEVDIALDPFPYNGTTTTCEALWMGVPVVSLRGDRHAGRVGASLLTRIGLPELVADSVQAYVGAAAALAHDLPRLTDFRRTLRERMTTSPLCDAPAFARQIEAAYRQMWRTFCEGAGRNTTTAATGPGSADQNQLVALFNQGRNDEAEKLARTMTRQFPDHGFGWNALGAILNKSGRVQDALASAQKAARLLSNDPSIHNNLGVILRDLGRLAEAETSYRRAVAIKPDYAEAHSNLGGTLQSLGRLQEAEACFRRAIEIRPGFAGAHSNLGSTLKELGRLEEAEASCRRAIEIAPDQVEAHNNLGGILQDLGRLTEAEASCRRALEIRPDYVQPLVNLGGILRVLGRPEEAEASCRRALEIRPDNAAAHNNLGGILQGLARHAEAEACYRRALEIRPDYAKAHNNLGNVLSELVRLEEAEACYRRALEIRPDYANVHNNLGTTFLRLGRPGEAELCFRRAIGTGPNDAGVSSNTGGPMRDFGRQEEAAAGNQRALGIGPDHITAHSNLLLCLNYLPHASTEVCAEHRRWGEQQMSGCVTVARAAVDHNPRRRLRVGYVSPDLREHPVASFIEPLLREHDRSAVEIFCYADGSRPDAVTARLQGLADHWLRTVGLSDQALAQRIAADQIDILVDLAGHTANNRLPVFARRPAPVQVTWLGYPNTTGLRAMDYRLVDEITDPAGAADALATEQLVRLDKGFLCYAAPAEAPRPASPPSLASGNITFGSFNNPAKLSPGTLEAWAAILQRIPNSRLLLKGLTFTEAGGRTHFLARLGSLGVDAGRVTLHGRKSSLENHLADYSQVDIALDPFPYNGTTTTCEALWMGVPVVCLCGDRHAGRVGASLMTQIGLTELVADSVQAYVEIAATLARDQARLTDFRGTLRERMVASPLCNAPAFARKIEAAYRQMWRTSCEQQPGNSPS